MPKPLAMYVWTTLKRAGLEMISKPFRAPGRPPSG